MHKILNFGFILILSVSSCTKKPVNQKDFAQYVNPFIGTDSDGHTFPGAVLPFGMLQLSPDTRIKGSDYATGYHYSDSSIMGFSHTRYSGTGRGAGGDFLLIPTTGKIQLTVGEASNTASGYRSSFSHNNEEASPGYYKVLLDDYNITAELTVNKRVGLHRYTYPVNEAANIILDLTHGINDRPDSLYLIITGDNSIAGMRKSLGGLRDFQTIYFTAEFSEPFDSYGVSVNGNIETGVKEAAGKDVKAWFTFKNKETIMVKLAISKVGIDGAEKNIATMPGWDFDEVKEKAREEWNKELGKIAVKTRTSSLDTIFYTALYHSCIMPSLDMDADGRYRSTNNNIYTAKGFTDYTNFSLWDTFRALHPLMTIINTNKSRDFVKTLLERYEHSGSMPVFELSGNDLLVMIGYHSLPVIADAYVKGINDFDVKKAVEGMKALANMPFEERNEYRTFGYIPYDYTSQSVSRTLEYGYDDWCVARVSKNVDRKTYLEFMQRSRFYRNLYDEETGFMRPKNTVHQWSNDFNPLAYTRYYTQGNAWQYSTFVPQDIHGLITLMGGDKAFEKWLDTFFTTKNTKTYQGRTSDLLIGQYYHGNEPSHHVAYLYIYAGVPWKTQEMVRRIMDTQYSASPEGLAGNDDAGQMSAWYILSAMGFYSVTPGMDYYVIGSPQFDEAVINLENGKTFRIKAVNNRPENVYIQSVTLNGRPYNKSYIKHNDIMAGGTMVFEMGSSLGYEWAVENESRPYLPEFASAGIPQITVKNKKTGRDGVITFNNSCDVSVSCATRGAVIYYTLNGRDPDLNSEKYSGGIRIKNSCTLKVKAFKEGINPGYTATVKFRKMEPLPAMNVQDAKPGVKYEYREVWICKVTSQIDQYPVLKKGVLPQITSDTGFKTASNYGMIYNGYVKIPETGTYTFYLNTEYAGAIWVDDVLIASNESTDWLGERSGTIALQKGFHKIKVKYFQVGGETKLQILWKGPGIKKQKIPANVLMQ